MYGTNNHKVNAHSRMSPDQKEREEVLKIEKLVPCQK